MNEVIFRVYVFFFTSMHVLNFVSWICVTCFSNNIGTTVWLGIIIPQPPEKGVPWKFWLDPQFPRDPKIKWILKWPPLDRSYFKVYFFTKGESLLIIPCHTYLSTRNLFVLFQVMFALPYILFLLNCPVIHHYWLMILQKKAT